MHSELGTQSNRARAKLEEESKGSTSDAGRLGKSTHQIVTPELDADLFGEEKLLKIAGKMLMPDVAAVRAPAKRYGALPKRL